jgi:hypothetical protein
MRVINSGLTIVLAVCFGIACPAALAAGVDAKSMVDAKVKCALPAVLAQAVREHARQEIENLKDEFESMKKWAGPERPPSYRWCAVDLNDDGRPEVIYHSGLSDRTVDPDGVTINRDRNEFRIGQNIPEAEREQRLRDELGWSPFDWAGAEPGYRDEPYRTEN